MPLGVRFAVLAAHDRCHLWTGAQHPQPPGLPHMSDMQYEAVPQRNRVELEQLLAGKDPQPICDGLLSASYWEPDWQWVQEWCLHYLDSPDSKVRAFAAQGLGYLAVFHGKSDMDRVIPRLTALLSDPEVGGISEDAIEDIRHFVIKLKGRVKGERLPPP